MFVLRSPYPYLINILLKSAYIKHCHPSGAIMIESHHLWPVTFKTPSQESQQHQLCSQSPISPPSYFLSVIFILSFLSFRLLNANKIACLRVDAFQDLHNLNLLSLYDNKLQTIAKGTFSSLRAIQTLYVHTQRCIHTHSSLNTQTKFIWVN